MLKTKDEPLSKPVQRYINTGCINNVCPICQDDLGWLGVVELVCRHGLHYQCYLQYLHLGNDNPTCPLCRGPLQVNPGCLDNLLLPLAIQNYMRGHLL